MGGIELGKEGFGGERWGVLDGDGFPGQVATCPYVWVGMGGMGGMGQVATWPYGDMGSGEIGQGLPYPYAGWVRGASALRAASALATLMAT